MVLVSIVSLPYHYQNTKDSPLMYSFLLLGFLDEALTFFFIKHWVFKQKGNNIFIFSILERNSCCVKIKCIISIEALEEITPYVFFSMPLFPLCLFLIELTEIISTGPDLLITQVQLS